MNETLYIPDLVGAVVAKVSTTFSSRPSNPFSVYYEPGYHSDVQQILNFKDGDPSKPGKYPLVWLVVPNKVVDDLVMNQGSTELHLFIIQLTSNTALLSEKKGTTINPYLLPIYDEFKRQMALQTRYFITQGTKPNYQIIHDARADTVNTNLFSDFVDVIEVRWNLKVKNICITD